MTLLVSTCVLQHMCNKFSTHPFSYLSHVQIVNLPRKNLADILVIRGCASIRTCALKGQIRYLFGCLSVYLYNLFCQGIHQHLATGQGNSKFGIHEENLWHIVSEIRQKHGSYIEVVGLHCHLGSTIDNIKLFR